MRALFHRRSLRSKRLTMPPTSNTPSDRTVTPANTPVVSWCVQAGATERRTNSASCSSRADLLSLKSFDPAAVRTYSWFGADA